MKTLSVTEGRQRLGYWLEKAWEGEDIAFAFNGKVVALRPVEVYSEDYALSEYGVSEAQLDRFVAKAHEEIKKDRQTGKIRPFTGKL